MTQAQIYEAIQAKAEYLLHLKTKINLYSFQQQGPNNFVNSANNEVQVTRISRQAVGAPHPDLSGAIRTLGLPGGHKHPPGRGSPVPRFIRCSNI